MLKVIEAFAGVGSQRMALRNLGIEHEVVGIFEIDKFALKSYEAIHGECPNLGDISKINVKDIPKHDLFTYSFPCQDLSVAGKQKGIVRGGTRSGLLYECEKIIEHCKPKYLLMENVKNLVGKKFKVQFDEWLAYLETLGYMNYWDVLNARDYDIPQNRERVFVVSILGEHKPYEFPKPIKSTKAFKDVLEDSVGEKYCLSEMVQQRFKQTNSDDGTKNIIGTTAPPTRTIGQRDVVYGYNTKVMGALVATDYKHPKQIISYLNDDFTEYKIRKITPREAFRLMGMKDSDIDKIQQVGLSNSQQYKIAGNSIVVDVLEGIFKELFLSEKENNERDFEIVKLGNAEVEQFKWVI